MVFEYEVLIWKVYFTYYNLCQKRIYFYEPDFLFCINYVCRRRIIIFNANYLLTYFESQTVSTKLWINLIIKFFEFIIYTISHISNFPVYIFSHCVVREILARKMHCCGSRGQNVLWFRSQSYHRKSVLRN